MGTPRKDKGKQRVVPAEPSRTAVSSPPRQSRRGHSSSTERRFQPFVSGDDDSLRGLDDSRLWPARGRAPLDTLSEYTAGPSSYSGRSGRSPRPGQSVVSGSRYDEETLDGLRSADGIIDPDDLNDQGSYMPSDPEASDAGGPVGGHVQRHQKKPSGHQKGPRPAGLAERFLQNMDSFLDRVLASRLVTKLLDTSSVRSSEGGAGPGAGVGQQRSVADHRRPKQGPLKRLGKKIRDSCRHFAGFGKAKNTRQRGPARKSPRHNSREELLGGDGEGERRRGGRRSGKGAGVGRARSYSTSEGSSITRAVRRRRRRSLPADLPLAASARSPAGPPLATPPARGSRTMTMSGSAAASSFGKDARKTTSPAVATGDLDKPLSKANPKPHRPNIANSDGSKILAAAAVRSSPGRPRISQVGSNLLVSGKDGIPVAQPLEPYTPPSLLRSGGHRFSPVLGPSVESDGMSDSSYSQTLPRGGGDRHKTSTTTHAPQPMAAASAGHKAKTPGSHMYPAGGGASPSHYSLADSADENWRRQQQRELQERMLRKHRPRTRRSEYVYGHRRSRSQLNESEADAASQYENNRISELDEEEDQKRPSRGEKEREQPPSQLQKHNQQQKQQQQKQKQKPEKHSASSPKQHGHKHKDHDNDKDHQGQADNTTVASSVASEGTESVPGRFGGRLLGIRSLSRVSASGMSRLRHYHQHHRNRHHQRAGSGSATSVDSRRMSWNPWELPTPPRIPLFAESDLAVLPHYMMGGKGGRPRSLTNADTVSIAPSTSTMYMHHVPEQASVPPVPPIPPMSTVMPTGGVTSTTDRVGDDCSLKDRKNEIGKTRAIGGGRGGGPTALAAPSLREGGDRKAGNANGSSEVPIEKSIASYLRSLSAASDTSSVHSPEQPAPSTAVASSPLAGSPRSSTRGSVQNAMLRGGSALSLRAEAGDTEAASGPTPMSKPGASQQRPQWGGVLRNPGSIDSAVVMMRDDPKKSEPAVTVAEKKEDEEEKEEDKEDKKQVGDEEGDAVPPPVAIPPKPESVSTTMSRRASIASRLSNALSGIGIGNKDKDGHSSNNNSSSGGGGSGSPGASHNGASNSSLKSLTLPVKSGSSGSNRPPPSPLLNLNDMRKFLRADSVDLATIPPSTAASGVGGGGALFDSFGGGGGGGASGARPGSVGQSTLDYRNRRLSYPHLPSLSGLVDSLGGLGLEGVAAAMGESGSGSGSGALLMGEGGGGAASSQNQLSTAERRQSYPFGRLGGGGGRSGIYLGGGDGRTVRLERDDDDKYEDVEVHNDDHDGGDVGEEKNREEGKMEEKKQGQAERGSSSKIGPGNEGGRGNMRGPGNQEGRRQKDIGAASGTSTEVGGGLLESTSQLELGLGLTAAGEGDEAWWKRKEGQAMIS